ncbi:hypothetical protein [Hymenobacter fodinae]|uniref:Uncharacterized protein n=1 Tax=Hymenobacter fodinae TaxID=2510796 RepID=A0A4Z0P0B1_9BACT|nr:hypothetical protein [Hymenobacter fodinae]TGE03826.1 hypothetical protein EU556_24780 [Hymenobacter fodinae]
MKIRFAWWPLMAFVALQFFLGEAHELVHTGVGRLLCGCWGPRDFNVWSLCATCEQAPLRTMAATVAGPLFTFAMMGWGYRLLAPQNPIPHRSLGFALVFANLPVARLLGAVFMGGNDEVYALRPFLPYPLAWAVGATFVVAAVALPVARAYTALHPHGRRGVFLAFFFLPMALTVAVVLGVLNSLLAAGFLAMTGVLGSPWLVTGWTLTVCLALGSTYRHLFALGQPATAVQA